MKENSQHRDTMHINRIEYKIKNLENAFNELSEFVANLHEDHVQFKRQTKEKMVNLKGDTATSIDNIFSEIESIKERE